MMQRCQVPPGWRVERKHVTPLHLRWTRGHQPWHGASRGPAFSFYRLKVYFEVNHSAFTDTPNQENNNSEGLVQGQ